MAKKKKEEEEELKIEKLKVRGTMSGEQYWRWRTTIEEGDVAKAKAEVSHLKCQMKVLEAERTQLQMTLLRQGYKESQNLVLQAKEEYDNVKKEIEQDLGVSIDGCSINPHTYEVQELPID